MAKSLIKHHVPDEVRRDQVSSHHGIEGHSVQCGAGSKDFVADSVPMHNPFSMQMM